MSIQNQKARCLLGRTNYKIVEIIQKHITVHPAILLKKSFCCSRCVIHKNWILTLARKMKQGGTNEPHALTVQMTVVFFPRLALVSDPTWCFPLLAKTFACCCWTVFIPVSSQLYMFDPSKWCLLISEPSNS